MLKKLKVKKTTNHTSKIEIQNIDINTLKEELKRENYKRNYLKLLKSTIYYLLIVASISALIATIFMPVLKISGSSMSPTLNDSDIVISFKNNKLKQGDVIAFYHGNKILIKRVIATSGEFVNIDETGKVYVNGNPLEEKYVENLSLGETDITYPYQVPEKSVFVLGDYRLTSIDSRNKEIGAIEQDDIIGIVILRVWPIKRLGKVS